MRLKDLLYQISFAKTINGTQRWVKELAPILALENEKPYKHYVYRVFCGERGVLELGTNNYDHGDIGKDALDIQNKIRENLEKKLIFKYESFISDLNFPNIEMSSFPSAF